jgi:hypothetical protein
MKKITKLIFCLIAIFLCCGCSDMIQKYTSGPHSLDVMILFDLTGSLVSALSNIKAGFTLEEGDYWVGVAGFQDFPIEPYGYSSDEPYVLFQSLSPSIADTQTAINSMEIEPGDGNDNPEAHLEALYQVATGAGYDPYIEPSDAGWRDNTKKAVIIITDAPFHDEPAYPGHTYSQTLNALNKKDIIVMGILLGQSNITSIIEATHGQYYSISSTGAGINQALQSILEILL